LLKNNNSVNKENGEINEKIQDNKMEEAIAQNLKLYSSLLGLHTLRSRNKIDKKTLKHLLDNLEDFLKSDLSMLLDLLTALVTSNDEFEDIMEELEINERVSRLLFISKHKHRDYS